MIISIFFAPTNTGKVAAQAQDDPAPRLRIDGVAVFGNSNPITVNDNAAASPYPSTITVSGVNPAYMTSVRVSLTGFTHSYPDDVDMFLVGPQGQRAVLMSDAGGGSPGVVGATIGFEQSAAAAISDTSLTAGLYRPANYETSTDTFPSPGPGALFMAPADLSVFNGTNPNGTWSLYVVDDAAQDSGLISGGWQLRFTVPTVFTVNSAADPGDGTCDATCTLRDAIIAANASVTGSELIAFSSAFNAPQTIDLQTALPDISKSVTINGPGANLLTVRRSPSAGTNFRIFTIGGGIANGVTISGMTISNGNATGFGDGSGGGISSNQSSLVLTNVHVAGNRSGIAGGGVSLGFADGLFTGCTFSGNTVSGPGSVGGGISFQDSGGHTLRMVNSTVSGNSAGVGGGGIENLSAGGNSRLEVVNSTITGNMAASGGIETFAFNSGVASTALRNSIIAGNSSTNLVAAADPGGVATTTTNGFNLSDNYNGVFTPLTTDITASPLLGPLGNYGGTMPMHPLLNGSPAIDAGNNSSYTTDQRGQARPFDIPTVTNVSDGSDIGAFELQASPVPAVCVPVTTNACSLGDRLSHFSLTGEGSAIDNNSGNTCSTNPLGYSDNTAIIPAVTLATANTYSGLMQTGNANDYATIWIDQNDNGVFENPERVLDNLQIGTIDKLYGIYVPASFPPGLHRMRVRIVGSAGAPAGPTDPCASTATGETEDYVVNIAASGAARSVANGTPGSCLVAAAMTIGPNSNNTVGFGVPLVDSSNNLIATVFANGNNLGTVRGSFYVNNGPVRQVSGGRYYLDRNVTIATDNQPATPYNLRLFIKNSELNALIAQPGSGVTSVFDLYATKSISNACANSFTGGSPTSQSPTGFGSLGGDRFLDFTGLTSFSSFFLHGGSTALSVGEPTAAATAANVNAGGASPYTFTVTYTDDTGVNVSSIGTGDVTVTGPNGFSSTPTFLSSSFTQATSVTATYSFTPPGGGGWDASTMVPITSTWLRARS